MKKPHSMDIEPHQILNQAELFLIAAQRLRTEEPTNKGTFVLQSGVCAALSIELFFKYLIFLSTKSLADIKTHKLDVLFNKITPPHRQAIMENITSIIPEDQFNYILKKSSNAFISLRYIYECDEIYNPTWLHKIADLLNNECQRISKKSNEETGDST